MKTEVVIAEQEIITALTNEFFEHYPKGAVMNATEKDIPAFKDKLPRAKEIQERLSTLRIRMDKKFTKAEAKVLSLPTLMAVCKQNNIPTTNIKEMRSAIVGVHKTMYPKYELGIIRDRLAMVEALVELKLE
jgi:hypothetical protein